MENEQLMGSGKDGWKFSCLGGTPQPTYLLRTRLRRLTLGISNANSIAMSLPSSFFVNNHAEYKLLVSTLLT